MCVCAHTRVCVRGRACMCVCACVCVCVRDGAPTPADEHVGAEGDGGGVDDHQQRVEVQPLHQQPEEVGGDEVVEEHQAALTAHLSPRQPP